MPKPNQIWTRFKGSIIVAAGAIVALVVVITGTDVDDKLCEKWAPCKGAYDQGQAGNTQPSPTTVE